MRNDPRALPMARLTLLPKAKVHELPLIIPRAYYGRKATHTEGEIQRTKHVTAGLIPNLSKPFA